jgi:hypothetical protein
MMHQVCPQQKVCFNGCGLFALIFKYYMHKKKSIIERLILGINRRRASWLHRPSMPGKYKILRCPFRDSIISGKP